jgi:hypothetical protein
MSLRFEGSKGEGFMRRILVALAAAAVLSAVQAGAEERLAAPGSHLVTPDVAQARLLEASAERQRNLATVDAFLASPQGTAGIGAVGTTGARVRASVQTLSDAELQDVAARAAALQADPVAGALTNRQWLWIAAGAAVVILIILIA